MQLKTYAFVFGLTAILGSSGEKFFRRDYTYFEEYNAFYKLHWSDSSRSWEEAFETCADEGAKLFYPEGLEERTVAANLSESLTDGEAEIFIGIRDEINRGFFISIDGRFIPELSNYAQQYEADTKCIVMSVTTGSYSVKSCEPRRPFICKKIDNECCPTIDSAYMYSKATNKCYKVHKRPKTWQDAVATCYMEGAILSSLTENIESTFLPNLIRGQTLFTGIRRILPQSSFYSLTGSKFELSEVEDNTENCKIMEVNRPSSYYDNPDMDNNYRKYVIRSRNCNTLLPFVCEMHLKV